MKSRIKILKVTVDPNSGPDTSRISSGSGYIADSGKNQRDSEKLQDRTTIHAQSQLFSGQRIIKSQQFKESILSTIGLQEKTSSKIRDHSNSDSELTEYQIKELYQYEIDKNQRKQTLSIQQLISQNSKKQSIIFDQAKEIQSLKAQIRSHRDLFSDYQKLKYQYNLLDKRIGQMGAKDKMIHQLQKQIQQLKKVKIKNIQIAEQQSIQQMNQRFIQFSVPAELQAHHLLQKQKKLNEMIDQLYMLTQQAQRHQFLGLQ